MPSTVTVTIEKGKGDRVGLALVSSGGRLEITKILDGGILSSSTALRAGMELISINGESVVGKTSVTAVEMLTAVQGPLTLVANRPAWPPGALVTCTLHKRSPDSKIGIGFGRKPNGRVAITSLKEDGLAYNSELDVGMTIRMINNVKCMGRNPKQIAALLAEAKGSLVILAQVPQPKGPNGEEMDMQTAPKGVEEGGVWEERKFYGPTSVMASVIGVFFFLVPGLIPICYPLDTRKVYVLDNKVYNEKGDCIMVVVD